MRIVLLSFLFICSVNSFAQSKKASKEIPLAYFNSIRLDSIHVKFVQLELTSVFTNSNYTMALSYYGQPNGNLFNQICIEDLDGDKIRVNNVVEALTILDYYGWEYLETFKEPQKQIFLFRNKNIK